MTITPLQSYLVFLTIFSEIQKHVNPQTRFQSHSSPYSTLPCCIPPPFVLCLWYGSIQILHPRTADPRRDRPFLEAVPDHPPRLDGERHCFDPRGLWVGSTNPSQYLQARPGRPLPYFSFLGSHHGPPAQLHDHRQAP